MVKGMDTNGAVLSDRFYKTSLAYGMDDGQIGVPFREWSRDLSLFHSAQTGSGTHTVSYQNDTGDSL
jgi:hypothetical protein